LPSIIKRVKSKRMRLAGHVTRIGRELEYEEEEEGEEDNDNAEEEGCI
jgi:hypothetical protein